MKKLLACVAITLLSIGICSKAASTEFDGIVIEKDSGGDVPKYLNGAFALKRHNIKIQIRGECSSACTILIHEHFVDNVCISDEAWFGFHRPFVVDQNKELALNPSDHMIAQKEFYSTLMWQGYHKDIKDYLNEHGWPDAHAGAETTDYTIMRYDDVKHIIKTCGD